MNNANYEMAMFLLSVNHLNRTTDLKEETDDWFRRTNNAMQGTHRAHQKGKGEPCKTYLTNRPYPAYSSLDSTVQEPHGPSLPPEDPELQDVYMRG